jgi:hypothetical protein
MTLEQFRATKKFVPDLGVPTQDESCEGQPGLTYLDVLFIQTRTDAWRGHPADPFKYMLVIGREEYLSCDLTELEQKLYAFAQSEGYFENSAVSLSDTAP